MFRTQVDIPESHLNINHADHIMALGSCFAENMGKKMSNAYFLTDVNPFGVIYNPITISNSIELLLQNKQFTKEDLFENKSIWQSFSNSSQFSNVTAEGCLKNINSRLNFSGNFFSQTNVLIITFGTAWIFQHVKSGKIVSNCHKLPASEFIRRRLTIEEIVFEYRMLIQKLQSLNPNLHIIFSVSPIRHWKDGAHENNISKSTLLLAIDEIKNLFSKIHYFPAYELQLDELRDYRFYASDMQHPSDMAIDYIWKRFSDTFFTEHTKHTCKKLEKYAIDLEHRPIHPESNEYKLFLDKIQERKEKLLAEFPFLSDRLELRELQS